MALWLADAILVLHLVFIAFVVLGQLGIMAGFFAGWRWVRNFAFRVCHLVAIGFVAAQAWLGRICPLTLLESRLREAGGQQPYSRTFVEYWVGRLVYYDAPPWVFVVAYSAFGALVLASWFIVKPRRRH